MRQHPKLTAGQVFDLQKIINRDGPGRVAARAGVTDHTMRRLANGHTVRRSTLGKISAFIANETKELVIAKTVLAGPRTNRRGTIDDKLLEQHRQELEAGLAINRELRKVPPEKRLPVLRAAAVFLGLSVPSLQRPGFRWSK